MTASDAATVVHLQAVRKAFNAGTPIETEVLHGIGLRLRRGEFCAVMGPSGSGQSTLLNIVGLLDRPTSGQRAGHGDALLLADEPTGNLDSKRADAVFDLLHRVNREQGTAVLFGTHNVALAQRCDRTIQVIDGRVVG